MNLIIFILVLASQTSKEVVLRVFFYQSHAAFHKIA